MPAFPDRPTVIPDIAHFLAPTTGAALRADTRPSTTYALHVQAGNEDVPQDYRGFMGRVFPFIYSHFLVADANDAVPDGRKRVVIGQYQGSRAQLNEGFIAPFAPLIAVGSQAIRQGESVFGLSRTKYGGDTPQRVIEVFSRTIPALEPGEQDALHAKYYGLRAAIDGGNQLAVGMAAQDYGAREQDIERDKFFRVMDGDDPSLEDRMHRFGTFDQRLLLPALQEINASTLSFSQLQQLYPRRIAALGEGYVTMGKLFLVKLPLAVAEEAGVQPFRDDYEHVAVPMLSTLYEANRLQQAGFSLLLAESESPPGFSDTDMPIRSEFAVMAKPTTVLTG